MGAKGQNSLPTAGRERDNRGLWLAWVIIGSYSIKQAQGPRRRVEGAGELAPVRLEDSDGDRAPSTLFTSVDSPCIGLLRPAAKA